MISQAGPRNPMFAALLLAAAALRHAAALNYLTPDHPWGLPASSLQPLSSTAPDVRWTASSATFGITVNATVPGDLVTDLQHAGVIGDPFFELGFLNTTTPGAQGAPLWDTGVWTFSCDFAAAVRQDAALFLVLDGVKMAADVALNGVPLGGVMDQFLRYALPLPQGALRPPPARNVLTVAFGTSRDPRNAEGRFSGASGGWDWAP